MNPATERMGTAFPQTDSHEIIFFFDYGAGDILLGCMENHANPPDHFIPIAEAIARLEEPQRQS